MEAIETLMAEHRIILRGCDALQSFAEEVRRGGGEPAELARFVAFIREFADAHHHAKEENFLFAAMVEAGFPKEAGPIAVMLFEHDAGRRHVAELAELAGRTSPWTGEDRERVSAAAIGYADLLRGHIHKEDAILYPMAEQRLPESLARSVDDQAAAFEAAHAADRERLEALGGELVRRHAPPLAATA